MILYVTGLLVRLIRTSSNTLLQIFIYKLKINMNEEKSYILGLVIVLVAGLFFTYLAIKPEEMEELQIEDLIVGEGEEAKVGDTVKMHYIGTLEDGTEFDSNTGDDEPFEFTIGMGMVIQGWEEGIPGLKVGGKRKLTIPAHLGYGETGSGSIPGGATIYFEVELVEIVKEEIVEENTEETATE